MADEVANTSTEQTSGAEETLLTGEVIEKSAGEQQNEGRTSTKRQRDPEVGEGVYYKRLRFEALAEDQNGYELPTELVDYVD